MKIGVHADKEARKGGNRRHGALAIPVLVLAVVAGPASGQGVTVPSGRRPSR